MTIINREAEANVGSLEKEESPGSQGKEESLGEGKR